jgi:hypothetical protein
MKDCARRADKGTDMKFRFMATLALTLAACGGTTTQPVKLTGKLQGVSSTSQDNPLLLAMGWYPAFAGTAPGTPAAAVLTQANLSYQGNFPLEFSFSLDGPPPAAALFDLSTTGGSGHIAYGVLIAFRDLNHNGALDSFAASGTPIDQIAGISVPDTALPPPEHSYFVLYLDGAVAANDVWGAEPLRQGYNLMEIHYNFGIEPVPLDTPITIPITNDAAVNLYGCSNAFDTPVFQRTCGIDPYDGKMQMSTNFFSEANRSEAQFFVGAADGPVANATLSLDGVTLAYDATSESYLFDSSAPIPGNHLVSLQAPGFPAETLTFNMPGPVTMTSPVQGQQFTSGSPVNIAWNSVAGTAYYDIYFLDFNENWLFHTITNATSVTTPPITLTGNATLQVKAIAQMAVGTQGSYVEPVSQGTVTLTFVHP